MEWVNAGKIETRTYVCGHCSQPICSQLGYTTRASHSRIYICHNCGKPTYFSNDEQVPGRLVGATIQSIPADINKLYDEARRCFSVSSFTASVMASRKIIMNLAVAKGADPGMNFQQYVEFLNERHFIPPDGKDWVDHIRSKGNEANHEIGLMAQADAEELILFLEGLLRFIYEFPSRMKAKTPGPRTT